jgi:hypothetical protein
MREYYLAGARVQYGWLYFEPRQSGFFRDQGNPGSLNAAMIHDISGNYIQHSRQGKQ